MDTPIEPFKLIARIGEREVGRYSLERPGSITLGRSSSCELILDCDGVSRQHVRLILQADGSLLVEDLGSANGTFVDDVQLRPEEPIPISAHQTLGVGNVSVVFQHGESAWEDVEPNAGRGALPPSGVGSSISVASEELASNSSALPSELLATSRYSVGEVLAKGGMGAVLRAREAATRRTVAMKVMLGDTQTSPHHRLRFVEEAQITAQLEHPNIVPVHDLGVDGEGRVFYTMKLVQGLTLKKIIELLRDGTPGTAQKYSLPALLTIFQKVCDAVAFAHAKGVIHRDLKPANIMVGPFGEVLVMDWGLAKVIGKNGGTPIASGVASTQRSIIRTGSRSATPQAGAGPIPRVVQAGVARTVSSARQDEGEPYATLAGQVIGTPHYMAPEQARGETDQLDARSDIFALGAILYEILTLQRPFPGKTIQQVIQRVLSERPPIAPASLNQEKDPKKRRVHLPDGIVPESLSAVALKALAHRGEDRYPDVKTLQNDLTAYQSGFATSAEKASTWKQLKLFTRRNKAASIGVAAVLLVGTLFGTQAVLEGRRAERALAELKKIAPAMLQLADSEAGFQRFDSARERADAAIALDPEYRPSYWRRAWIFVGMEQLDDAAAAIRLARQKDPANAEQLGAILPTVEKLAKLPAAERWSNPLGRELWKYLRHNGASGEMVALSQQLKLAAEDKRQMVRQRMDEWLGRGKGREGVEADGSVWVDIPRRGIDTLEPLRGLPINYIYFYETKVTSIEPLRGMPISVCWADQTRISDLSPLRGAPLRHLRISETDVDDLSALAGAPLEELQANNLRVRDYSPLNGAPLRKVILHVSGVRRLDFLANAPIEWLEADTSGIEDLKPLTGKPLKILKLDHNKVSDLSPLRGAPIEELSIYGNPVRDITPLLELPKLRKLRVPKLGSALEPLRNHPTLKLIAYKNDEHKPVAEFWAEYDAQKTAEETNLICSKLDCGHFCEVRRSLSQRDYITKPRVARDEHPWI